MLYYLGVAGSSSCAIASGDETALAWGWAFVIGAAGGGGASDETALAWGWVLGISAAGGGGARLRPHEGPPVRTTPGLTKGSTGVATCGLERWHRQHAESAVALCSRRPAKPSPTLVLSVPAR
eukprot:XP_001697889.1 predicted protein [Chlamydomonas reinhardtii]